MINIEKSQIKQTLLELSEDTKSVVDESKIEKLINFFYFLKQENKKTNLISRKSTDKEILYKHFFSSFLFIKYIQAIMSQKSCKTIADVGTGAGFPGIVCSICFPDINLFLIESIKKKIVFLQDLNKMLNLSNVNLLNGRAEVFAKDKKYKEKFDIVTARALANIPLSLKYCFPLVRKGGYFLTIKSVAQQKEIQKAKRTIRNFRGNLEYFKEKGNIIVQIYKE